MEKVEQKAKSLKGMVKNNSAGQLGMMLVGKTFYHLFEKNFIRILDKLPFQMKKNRIVFESSVDYSDNARALCEYMLREGYQQQYEIIWLVNEPKHFSKESRKHLKFVKKKHRYSKCRTWKAYYYVWTAKYVFYTHAMKMKRKKHEEQVFINLWHGCGYKAAKGGSEQNLFDYCLVPGPLFVRTKAEFFKCPEKKILPLGYPRYDWMMQQNTERISKWKRLGIELEQKDKLVLWMPTFRKSASAQLSEETLSGELDLPLILNQQELEKLDKLCAEVGIVLVIKRHHLQKKYPIQKDKLRRIYVLEDEVLEQNDIQLYELLTHTDALLTDYSSIAIDYLLLDRPIGFVLDDYEAYREARGFVFEHPLDYMPGAHIYQKKELEAFLRDVAVARDNEKEQRKRVRQEAHVPYEKSYSKALLRKIQLII